MTATPNCSDSHCVPVIDYIELVDWTRAELSGMTNLPYHRGSHPQYSAEVDRIVAEELRGVDPSNAAEVQQAIERINQRARDALTDGDFVDDSGKLI